MNVLLPVGTRPEIIKAAPVVHALRGVGIEVTVLATGQHYDQALAGAFFEALHMEPDVVWHLPEAEGARVGAILERAMNVVSERRPDLVMVLGDTYTVPLFCLAARRFAVPVAHLEAGLRSLNLTSTEEVNRRVAGGLASLHLAPTDLAARFLRKEGIEPERIRVVGNPIIDVLATSGIARRPIEERKGVVVTAHRATNVDNPERLGALVTLIGELADFAGTVTFPVHPRTRARLDAAGLLRLLDRPGVDLLDPLEWHPMLDTLARCRVVVTDSGGLQEEASWFGVPAVVLRRSTPRWEGVAAGSSVLVGLDIDMALAAVAGFCTPAEQRRVSGIPCPYGDGRTAVRVAEILADPATASILRLEEPDFVGKDVPS